MWRAGSEREQYCLLGPCPLSLTSPATHKQIVPFEVLPWCWFPVGGLVYILGPCGPFQQTLLWDWQFLPPLQPPQVFTARGFEANLLTLEPWVEWSVSLPICSSWFIRTRMLTAGSTSYCFAAHSLLCGCLSQPLLLVWMNISSLTPWSLDFHTVQFSGSSGCFLFLNWLLSFFGCVRKWSISNYASIFARPVRHYLNSHARHHWVGPLALMEGC